MISEIFVEEGALGYELTREVLSRAKGLPVEVIPSYKDYPFPFKPWPELLSWGKNRLFILRYAGKFFRACPGTTAYLCCGYLIFHFGEGCPLDCSYCILQAYLNRPGLKLWANLFEDGLPELREAFGSARASGRILRIGTGEFADSLALEPYCGVAEKLVRFWVEEDPPAVLELKTKVAPADEWLANLPRTSKVVFAWSVNTRRMTEEEEIGAARLEERLRSAQKAAELGFAVAFHFDPIVLFPETIEAYLEVVEAIFEAVPAERIVWISLGTLRYIKELKEIAEERFPKTRIYAGEFVTGLDGKSRYFRPLRVAAYRALYQRIRDFSSEVCVYLCMESPEVWQEAFGFTPQELGGLPRMLDEAARRVCGL
ncbi:SPL family radical SAM protein [Thermosulfurimonas dismutans]|uniref:Spore photoproduct lyase n=1 Tax=Thermosulfurimonas dismutans TaxID=999894 RepID=A0A179D6L6_9BACT|nr:DNA photolyase [Thermosulfurimonas dismutans]OAQ21248.1 Spore photoproduct lyase [Thermosulfurimonas dismutans]